MNYEKVAERLEGCRATERIRLGTKTCRMEYKCELGLLLLLIAQDRASSSGDSSLLSVAHFEMYLEIHFFKSRTQTSEDETRKLLCVFLRIQMQFAGPLGYIFPSLVP
jgi:hypothetical protein